MSRETCVAPRAPVLDMSVIYYIPQTTSYHIISHPDNFISHILPYSKQLHIISHSDNFISYISYPKQLRIISYPPFPSSSLVGMLCYSILYIYNITPWLCFYSGAVCIVCFLSAFIPKLYCMYCLYCFVSAFIIYIIYIAVLCVNVLFYISSSRASLSIYLN